MSSDSKEKKRLINMLHIQHTEYLNIIIDYNDIAILNILSLSLSYVTFNIKECCFKVIHMQQSTNTISDTKTDLPNIFLPCRGDVEGE